MPDLIDAIQSLSKQPIVVRLRDSEFLKGLKDDAELEDRLRSIGIQNLPAFSNLKPDDYQLRRLFRNLTPERVDALETKARKYTEKESYTLPGLFWRHFVLDLAPDRDRQPFEKELLELKEHVEKAYTAPEVAYPLVNAANDPRANGQRYLAPGPAGIDAKSAWLMPGGDGTNQEVIDLEGGWVLDHEDLVDSLGNPRVTFVDAANPENVNTEEARTHGTQVLGVICAADNTKGIVGIAPNLAKMHVISHGDDASNIAEKISLAGLDLGSGGVLVLEVSLKLRNEAGGTILLPVEYDDDVFEAIKFVTNDLGITVVEAAGNGGLDLDTVLSDRDSGAILVGAASNANAGSATPVVWRRWDTANGSSNFGTRVNCFAWGDRVFTADPRNEPPYNNDFHGTSAATAIVAGAALLVQGMAQRGSEDTTRRRAPGPLRSILSDPTINTRSVNPAVDKIGVMPNLRAIATELGLVVPPLV